MAMKPLRQQIIDRIIVLGGEKQEFYEKYSNNIYTYSHSGWWIFILGLGDEI